MNAISNDKKLWIVFAGLLIILKIIDPFPVKWLESITNSNCIYEIFVITTAIIARMLIKNIVLFTKISKLQKAFLILFIILSAFYPSSNLILSTIDLVIILSTPQFWKLFIVGWTDEIK